MAEIKCPKCGTVISLEQSDLDSVVKQVRDEEFAHDLAERTKLIEAEKEQALKLAEVESTAALKQAQAESEAALRQAHTESESALRQVKAESEAALQKAMADRDAEIVQLRAKLESQEEAHRTQQQLAVTQAVSVVEKERDALKSAIEIKEVEQVRAEAAFKEQLAEQAKAKDEFIEYQKEEIERLKDMRARLSTKALGESLEVHCMNEFNRVRSMAFPNAYFERDTETVDGTKGDFIYRELDEDGTEIISIMFEMKNESDSDSRKLRNEDHFAKLDRDRVKKNCEFAVLVSLLEPENDFYNDGIADVSHRFPKMYVVRPQFFIPIISLLRQGALASLQYKRELALVRQQDLDVTTFERDLDTFKQGFFKNFEDASLRFGDAVKAIDKAIADLQKAREKLLVSNKHLTAANNKLEGLTVKKLTRKNPTMKAKFDALNEE